MLKENDYTEPTAIDTLVFEKLVPPDHYLRRVKQCIDFAVCALIDYASFPPASLHLPFPRHSPHVTPGGPPLPHPAAPVQPQGLRAAPRYPLPRGAPAGAAARRAARVRPQARDACRRVALGGFGGCAAEGPAQAFEILIRLMVNLPIRPINFYYAEL